MGPLDAFEVNLTYVRLLYQSGETEQYTDGPGYFRWQRPANRKRPRPLYPIYGSSFDINSPTNVQLFPHPMNQIDCSFYLNKQGTIPATNQPFYVNGFCTT